MAAHCWRTFVSAVSVLESVEGGGTEDIDFAQQSARPFAQARALGNLAQARQVGLAWTKHTHVGQEVQQLELRHCVFSVHHQL